MLVETLPIKVNSIYSDKQIVMLNTHVLLSNVSSKIVCESKTIGVLMQKNTWCCEKQVH